MSGPKVVDIRAVRASQERDWRTLRHRIEQELGQLKNLCRDEDADTNSSVVAAFEQAIAKLDEEHRKSPLPMLLDSVLDHATANLEFALQLKSDLQQVRLERIALAQAKRRSMGIALRATAERLRAAKQNELCDRLLSEPTDSNLQAALELLSNDRQQKAASELQSVANEIAGPATEMTLDQWLSNQVIDEDPMIQRLEQLAASVASLDGLHDVSDWLEEITAAANIAEASRRRLIVDSIAMRISDEQKRLQHRRTKNQQLDELEAELAAFDESADALRDRVTAARQNDIDSITDLESQVRKWCDAEAKRRDQTESRQAILAVLRSLGYDVRESMATAWADQGQVIVRDSSRQDYGVELSTVTGDRLRTQLVRFSDQLQTNERQRQRDVEVETQWCQAHATLINALENQGLHPEILASRPIGSAPVKVVVGIERAETSNTPDSRPLPPRQQKLP